MEKLIPNLILLVFANCVFGQQNISSIAVGSCSHEYDKDQMWPEIIAEDPGLFIWTGDIIYGDTHDMNILRKKYDTQKSHSDYQQLLKTIPVIGVWDDHDYGTNDGGKYYTKKRESKEALLDFLDVPANAPVRDHEGVYQAYTFGAAPHEVRVIILDCRYFRDTLKMSEGTGKRYEPNPQGDVLGEEQWTWLESELRNSGAALNIIISSIQVLAAEHNFEKWANFPKARKRLLNLITMVKPNPTFFISGDRHIAELSRLELEGLPYPLFDFTASGLTHTWSSAWEEKNSLRIGEIIIQKNYGLIQLDWSSDRPKVTFRVKGDDRVEYMKYIHDY